jgi:hypothetical protein
MSTQRIIHLALVLLSTSAAGVACGSSGSSSTNNDGSDGGGSLGPADNDAGTNDAQSNSADGSTTPDAGSVGPRTTQIVFLPQVSGFPSDVTPDGNTVLIQAEDSGDVYFYDTRTGKLAQKTSVAQAGAGEGALGISSTLRVIGSVGAPSIYAGIWSESGGWMNVADKMYPSGCDAFVADGFDLTADGTVGVGMVWNGCQTQAFRWTDIGGGAGNVRILQTLGTPLIAGKMPSNRATKIADNGSIIGGFAMNKPYSRTPAVWHADGTGLLLDPPVSADGEVLAITSDGSMVGGYLGTEAFTWTPSGGIVTLPRLASAVPTDQGLINAIAAGGKLAFGRYAPAMSPASGSAFVWTPGGGTRGLLDVLGNAGVSLPPEYTLWNVDAASPDGSVVVGTALSGNNVFVPFIVTMPASVYGP